MTGTKVQMGRSPGCSLEAKKGGKEGGAEAEHDPAKEGEIRIGSSLYYSRIFNIK